MTVYLFNVRGRGRKHRDLYARASDETLEPFFDLELSGPQAEMVRTIQPGTECIVGSQAKDSNVIFKTYRFARFEERATNEDPAGQRYRVFLGTPGPAPDASLSKREAPGTPRFKQFFNKLGNFKGRSAFQR
jgi:hypothetical protein